MAPLIKTSSAQLAYPLYACDFDASNLLVVGGGGGGGISSGVKNKITALDTTNPSEIREVGELEDSLEDSPNCIAVGARKGKATLVFTGVNSDLGELKQGKNQHLRVFGIEPAGVGKGKGKGKSPKKAAAVVEAKPATNKIAELSRSQLFTAVDDEKYQRVIRLSKPFPNQPQLGAVASGSVTSSKAPEIALFNCNAPATPLWSLKTDKEIVDLDLIQTGNDEFLLAYCNVHDIYVKTVSSKSANAEPKCVYVTPFSDSFEKPTVPKFSALRWLTKEFLLMVTNISKNGGVVLQILRLPESGTGQGHCRIVQSYRMPDTIRKASGLAVRNLTPPTSPTAAQGYTQFIIAVSLGGNKSIPLLKVDFQVEGTVSLVTTIKPFRTLTFSDPGAPAVTGLIFSNFTPPTAPVTASTPSQHLQLAAIGGTVIDVHTLPLFPVPLSVARGQSTTPRYVVALPSKVVARSIASITAIIGALLLAIAIQGVMEIRGTRPVWLNATNYVPTVMQEAFGKPYTFPADYNLAPSTLGDLYAKHGEGGDKVVIVQDTPEGNVDVGVAQQKDASHKTWKELNPEEKGAWKKKLSEAGHWAEEMGETVLKGIIFGELGGQIGQAVGG